MSVAGNWWPVWKAHTYNLNSGGYSETTMRWRVRHCDNEADCSYSDRGEVLYEGVAVESPAAPGQLNVTINDIAANYLSAPFQTEPGGTWHTQRLAEWFAIDAMDPNSGQWSGDTGILFTKDYSYDYAFNLMAQGLGCPVVGVAAPDQWLVASAVDVNNGGTLDWELYFADGTHQEVTTYLGRGADFNEDFNEDFAVEAQDAAFAGYGALYLGSYPGLVRVECWCDNIKAVEYAVAQGDCARHVLYYRNAYGGWDSVVPGAVYTRKEAYDRTRIGRWADNSVQGQRGIEQYANAVTEGWTFRLDNLTDAQAARMRHLLGSPDVYLCDLREDTLTPLLLTDTECVDKTYRNQGRKRISYTINAITAWERERR